MRCLQGYLFVPATGKSRSGMRTALGALGQEVLADGEQQAGRQACRRRGGRAGLGHWRAKGAATEMVCGISRVLPHSACAVGVCGPQGREGSICRAYKCIRWVGDGGTGHRGGAARHALPAVARVCCPPQ